jgi:hypothetical protein
MRQTLTLTIKRLRWWGIRLMDCLTLLIVGGLCFAAGWFVGYRAGERDGRRGYLDE